MLQIVPALDGVERAVAYAVESLEISEDRLVALADDVLRHDHVFAKGVLATLQRLELRQTTEELGQLSEAVVREVEVLETDEQVESRRKGGEMILRKHQLLELCQ